MTDRVVIWDFDGTLAWRPGLWGGCVLEVLDELEPGHGVAIEVVREGLRDGFPWHAADQPHLHLSESDAWWAPILDLIGAALVSAGVSAAQAQRVARAVRERFIDPSRGWRVFDDTVAALARLSGSGWSHVVLSNHVPELSDLIDGLGLARHFEHVVTEPTGIGVMCSPIRNPARHNTTVSARSRTPPAPAPAVRITAMISSTLGGSAG
jgi:putative hydrolase of the HAD superfamily